MGIPAPREEAVGDSLFVPLRGGVEIHTVAGAVLDRDEFRAMLRGGSCIEFEELAGGIGRARGDDGRIVGGFELAGHIGVAFQIDQR